jgi:cell division protein FtsB
MMISLANELAEKQLRDGTASSQVMVQYIKLGSTRESLEQERLKRDNELLRARVEQLSSGARNEELLENALRAFRGYSGTDEDLDEEEYYD